MLHMIVAKHGPDVCPASVPATREKYMPHMAQLPAISSKLGINVQGSWVDMPAHASYMVVDAPNAHVVSQMAMELHLMDWNTVEISPVITMDEAAQRAGAREI